MRILQIVSWLSLWTLASLSAQADELLTLQNLRKQGQYTEALDQANQFLLKNPSNAQMRFIKGLLLIDTGRNAEAIKIFQSLSQDYPELPEPYNNLAVLYARQQRYNLAQEALEMAIKTHPSYAQAYENLGDVYAQLAGQAYNRALQLNKIQPTQTKLALIQQLFHPPATRARPRPALSEPPEKPAPPAPSEAPRVPTPSAAPPAVTDPPPPTSSSAPSKPAPSPTASPSENEEKALLHAVDGWAQAWSKKKLGPYFAAYGRDFKTPDGLPRKIWEEKRRLRILSPKSIQIELRQVKAVLSDSRSAKVTFKQVYQSDMLRSVIGKTLLLKKPNDHWLIVDEQIVRH